MVELVRTRVYVAGPYSDGDTLSDELREEMAEIAIAAGDLLLDKGYAPFVPHLTHYWHRLLPHDYNEWLAYCMEWMRPCHCALFLPGKSSGAEEERVWATGKLLIPIFDCINKLLIAVPWRLPDGPPAETVKAAIDELERERKIQAMSDD